jgi:hypothetical protein
MRAARAERRGLQLEPDHFEPHANAFPSQVSEGAVEVWFDEPVSVAALQISVEFQGREVDVKVEASEADDEGFARLLVVSPRNAWPAAELTVRVANAIDVAGNTGETLSERVQVAQSSAAR